MREMLKFTLSLAVKYVMCRLNYQKIN